ncbi:MAG: amino acid permease [Sinobacteraceae bacterium]|nr:amino acid permease [Nevskiaceae bacterium]
MSSPAAIPATDTALSRTLRPRHMFMITIGGIIGAGLFVSSSAAIAVTGPAAVITYLITGLLVLMVMRMLGEMAVGNPDVRSFTEFARLGLGNWAGFSVGWLYWFFWVVVIPIEVIAAVNILAELGLTMPAWQSGCVLMAVMTLVNLTSARSFGEFEFWFSSIKVSAIIAFILVAAAHVAGFFGESAPGLSNLTAHGGFAPNGTLVIIATVTTVIFSMMGTEVVTIAAAESTEPAKSVARMTSSIIGRIMLFYVGSLIMIVAVVPWNSIVPGQSPFTAALDAMQIPYASTIMSVVILTAVLSCLNSCYYICSRVLFVLAEKGDAPSWLVKVNARRVPSRSVMLGSVAGVLGVVAQFYSPDGLFAFLVNASGALILVIYLTMAIAHVRLRRQAIAANRPVAMPMWLFPWLSYLTIAAIVAVLLAMALTPALQSQFWTGAVSIVVALAAYVVVARQRTKSA